MNININTNRDENKKNNLVITIMAAGEGKRMKSELPKVLHPCGDIPMVVRIIKESLLMFALSATRTTKDAAGLLGIRERDIYGEIKKFNIKVSDCNYED